MNKKEKAIEICINLEISIKKIGNKSVIKSQNPMFEVPTASASRLKQKLKEIIKKYNLTKKGNQWK